MPNCEFYGYIFLFGVLLASTRVLMSSYVFFFVVVVISFSTERKLCEQTGPI